MKLSLVTLASSLQGTDALPGIQMVNGQWVPRRFTLSTLSAYFGSGGGGVSDGDKGDITVSSGGASWAVDPNAITSAKFRQSAALSVVGNATNATANVTDIAASADGQVLRRSGTAIGFGAIDLSSSGAVGTSKLAFANLADVAQNAVLARTASGSGALTTLVAGSDGHVLRRDAGVIGWGTLATGSYADASVTNAKLANMASMTIKGNNAGGSGAPVDLTATQARTVLGLGTGALVNITVGTTAPGSPAVGDLWVDTN